MSDKPGIRTVVRRRGGEAVCVTRIDQAGERSSTDLLVQATNRNDLIVNIRNAASHLHRASENADAGKVATTIERRDDQDSVFRKTADFLARASAGLGQDLAYVTPMGRIIQPPRTGKTVLMGEIIAGSGATALILAPTLALVDQHREKLSQQLPTVAIGVLTGEEKQPRSRGITIATYSTLVSMHRSGTVPDWLRHITFVFTDEGHESMTKIRQDMIRDAFDPACVRIAFTATPDYDRRRALAMYYPELISEISLVEAYRLNLLAQFKVWAQVVDVDASTVRLVQGDYDQEEMSRLMSGGAVFETCRQVRWEKEDNASRATLICCGSKQQAYDLREYLAINCPAGSPLPEVILGDTVPEERQRLLHDFEVGTIDTLINVGVLLRGWDSARCKLLIDLHLSLSLVRSKQKYFRPLTRDKDAVASIWLIVPRRLPRDPVLPSVVFGTSVQETWVGEVVVTQPTRIRQAGTVTLHGRELFQEVNAKSETVLRGVGLPTLNPKSPQEIRLVIESELTFENGFPTYLQFRKVAFNHALFGGWGSTLLKYCGIYSAVAFKEWIQNLYPEQAGTDLLQLSRKRDTDGPCSEDAQALIDSVNAGNIIGDVPWRAVFGPYDDEEVMDPETALIKKEMWEQIQVQLEKLPVEYQHALDRVLSGNTTREDLHLDTIRRQVRRQMREDGFKVLLEKTEDRGWVYLLKYGRSIISRVPNGLKIKPDPQNPLLWVRDRTWAESFVKAFVGHRQDLAHGWHSLFTVEQEISTFKEEMIAKLLEGYE